MTLESLVRILADNRRGLLVYRDELNGWFQSFHQYTRGEGAMSGWIELYGGEMPAVDRKSDKTHVAAHDAALSVTGTIQPGILRTTLTESFYCSGLAARLLLAMPPAKAQKWTHFEADDEVYQRYTDMLDTLLCLQSSDDGKPAVVTLGDDARQAYIAFYDAHNVQTIEADERLNAAYAKLQETPLRLSLILHCVEHADAKNRQSPLPDMFTVQGDVMRRAIDLTEWFKNETSRVYFELAESESERQSRELFVWIKERGGRVTVRECQRHFWPFRKDSLTPDHVELQLAKICTREADGKRVCFVLRDNVTRDTYPKNTEE